VTGYTRLLKFLAVGTMGCLVASGSGSCMPDNYWSEVWAYTVVDTTIGAIVAAALGAIGL
jgi:hypothetical protein